MLRAGLILSALSAVVFVIAGCSEGGRFEHVASKADRPHRPSAADTRAATEYTPPPPPASVSPSPPQATPGSGPGQAGDRFDPIVESGFLAVQDSPYSTFSIDVDTAAYSKARQYLLQHGALPPPDAIRIEEFINYFDYHYAPPQDGHPFAVHAETAGCPWRPGHRLVRIGLKGRELAGDRPAANLVFLVDVSGSMDMPNKLPLVKQGLQMLVERLGERDRVAIVVYASAAGQVLPSTPAGDRRTISSAIDRLQPGGSTNGGAGIELAYRTAWEHFVAGGVNRVVLCTDGDFNVGVTSTGDLVRLAEQQAQSGVFLSVLGFGMGNHNDALLEQLSNKANGNYAFIDTAREAYRVLAQQLDGTLVTIAKDVKIQVEFNPARAAAYRLIGYENRRLADRDFNDDRKDAGDIGAGHTVTALYEVVPAGNDSDAARPLVDELKYQPGKPATAVPATDELLTVKVRYKQPDGAQSTKLTVAVRDQAGEFEEASADFRFAAAVASFGMLLRRSPYAGEADFGRVVQIADAARGPDESGARAEFSELVRCAARLSTGQQVARNAPATAMWYSTPPAQAPRAPRATTTPVRFGPLHVVVVGFFIVLGLGVLAVLVLACISLRRLAAAPPPPTRSTAKCG